MQPRHHRINHTPMYFNNCNCKGSKFDAFPDDGVTVTPKHVAAVLMQILILFLRQVTNASVGE